MYMLIYKKIENLRPYLLHLGLLSRRCRKAEISANSTLNEREEVMNPGIYPVVPMLNVLYGMLPYHSEADHRVVG